VVPVDEAEELPNLVGLGLAVARLEAEDLSQRRVSVADVASTDLVQLEAERLHQTWEIPERDSLVLASTQACQQQGRVHADSSSWNQRTESDCSS
jgi:hypothetical protein